MLDVLAGFVEELRSVGLPISLTETIDAAQATEAIPLIDRNALRAALGATLVKTREHQRTFMSVFEVYFSVLAPSSGIDNEFWSADDDLSSEKVVIPGRQGSDREAVDPAELRDALRAALRSGDHESLSETARLAVELFGGLEASRPVGVSYYLHKTLRSLDLAGILEELLQAVHAAPIEQGGDDPGTEHYDTLEIKVRSSQLNARADELRHLVEMEIQRQLVAVRGARALVKSLRRPLVEDIDFMHASAEDLNAMRRAIYPLARVLAARLAHKRRHRRRGPLDVRATIRRSLSTGGVPLEPRFKSPHPSRPEIFVLADVSGSVSAFSRFTVHLVYAISTQFSKVRSAVFIDGVDEVTSIFQRASSIDEAVEQISTQADVVDAHGHSNYGNAFRLFLDRYGKTLTKKTNLIILGDARSNYHSGEPEILAELRRRAHRVFWLNPEPRAYWGTGDSIINEYARYCDGVFECRTLRQLKAFVDNLA